MSILTVSNISTTAAAQTPAANGNSAQTEQDVLDAFAKALGQAVSFQPLGSFSSVPTILNQPQNTEPSYTPPQPQVQVNQQAQLPDNTDEQSDAPAAVAQPQQQSAPTQTVIVKATNTNASDTTTSTDQSKSDQASATVDPTKDQTVLAVVAQQILQPIVAPAPIQTTTATTTGPVVQNDTPNQGTTDSKGSTLVGDATQKGPQTNIQTPVDLTSNTQTNSQNQGDQTNEQAQTPRSFEFFISQPTGVATPQATAQTSGAAQQANDLAQSLDGTGANLSITVAVTDQTQTQTNTQTNTTTDASASQAVFVGLNPLTTGHDQQSNFQSADDQQQEADAALESTQASASASATTTHAPEVFSAALAAQLENTQAETPAAQAPQPTVTGVTAASNAQATQKTQSAQAPQAPAPTRPTLPTSVLDQVSVQVSKAAKEGVDSIKVTLNPQELGRVEIKLDVAKDGSVTTTVTAENKETLAMLQKDADGLAKALSDAGLTSGSGAMSFNLKGDGQQQFAGDTGSQNGSPRSRWSSLSTGSDGDAVSGLAAQSSGSLSAVDINV